MDIQKTINDLRNYLPIQFPLGIFIHNNMLLNFEEFPFEEGVKQASLIFGAKRTLEESYYLTKFREGRIHQDYLKREIKNYLKINQIEEMIAGVKSEELFLQLMLNPFTVPHAINYEKNKISKKWEEIFHAAETTDLIHEPVHEEFHRKKWKDHLRAEYGERVNDYFHPILIRFLGTYLDQGMGVWNNPDTHLGLLKSFQAFAAANRHLLPDWCANLESELLAYSDKSREEHLQILIDSLPYVQDQRNYLLLSLLELRGWAGMVNKFETEPHLIPRFAPKVELIDYCIIYITLEKSIVAHLMKKYQWTTLPLGKQNAEGIFLTLEQKTFVLDQIAQLLPQILIQQKHEILERLIIVTLEFDKLARTLIWQRAFDFYTRDHFLNTFASYQKVLKIADKKIMKPEVQYFFCIDDREESIRRNLEEINPRAKTYGVVGFFGIDMKFRSLAHPQEITQCPPVINPSKIVIEDLSSDFSHRVSMMENERTRYGRSHMKFYYNSRGSFSSAFFTFVSGPLTTLVLIARVFFPHLALTLAKKLKGLLVTEYQTEIRLTPSEDEQGVKYGYSVDEMAEIVMTILKFAGTLDHFSQFVFMIAHGGTSSNNPFKNAYGCGACSGKAGIPNAQTYCSMANKPEVRAKLKEKFSIVIPDNTYFIASYHDTSSDQISIFNEKIIRQEDRATFTKLKEDLIKAAKVNSLERCRNFESANHIHTPEAAFNHVNDRATSLAEPRPEYGHTNNSICIIGRRELTKNLYLDRRSFLTSYDATTDPEGTTLLQVMAGAVPVCGGINLDYYFSRIDNERYGSGTKLPLNVSSLLGVMTGGCSDLRIGLAQQMVELHEPVRITMMIEALPEMIKKHIDGNARQKKMAYNGWLHLVAIHPITGELSLFEQGEFVPYRPQYLDISEISNSIDYVKNRPGPLPFARVREVIV